MLQPKVAFSVELEVADLQATFFNLKLPLQCKALVEKLRGQGPCVSPKRVVPQLQLALVLLPLQLSVQAHLLELPHIGCDIELPFAQAAL